LRRARFFPLALVLIGSMGSAQAEPIFLSRQYARCTTCHYSPTGGGLLTPYGRSLSRQELSTTGSSGSAQPVGSEEEFLFGALGDALGPVKVGIALRPAHLNFNFGGTSSNVDLFMNADLLAAYRVQQWTFYAEIGRQPRSGGAKIDSYEYWVAHQPEKGIGFRVGRFLPAYGVRLADHTAFTRTGLGFDTYDQLYAVELSRTGERDLVQLSLGPGRAESILHDDGRRAFTATGRYQLDLSPRTALVLSGIYRNESRVEPRNGAGGLAFGIAPTPRLTVWTEADVRIQQGSDGSRAYTLLNETGFEVYRGVWLTVSPQLRTDFGSTSGGVWRLAFGANLLPRTHWNVGLTYYRDKNRANDLVTKTFLAQLHLYL
jgi:hypothetical protein